MSPSSGARGDARSRAFAVFSWVALGCLVGGGWLGCTEGDPLAPIREQHSKSEFAATVEPLRQLLERRPDDPEVNFLYGRALAMTQPSLAVWSLRKAMEDPEWFVRAGTQLALVALAAQDYNEAVEITTEILEREPENVRALLMRANAYAHSRQNPELALRDARRVLEIDPMEADAYEPLILALVGLEKLDEARASLDEVGSLLAERGDERLLSWHCATTAIFQQEAGEIDTARATWNGCLAKYPGNLDVVSNAMAFHDLQHEAGRSLAIVRAALEADPNSRGYRTTLARRLAATGETDEAEALLVEATSNEDPHRTAGAFTDLAMFRQSLGEHASAADAMARSIELQRDFGGGPSPQALFDYADMLVLAGRLEAAEEVADELTLPAHQHVIRARVLEEQHQLEQALGEFDEALRLWPDNAGVRYHAAATAEELGDFERALEEYRNSVRIAPGATDARLRGASLLLAMGSPAAAWLMLQTEMAEAPLGADGLLLGMYLAGRMGDREAIANVLTLIQASHPEMVGKALARSAAGLVARAGPRLGMEMLATAPIDLGKPRNAEGLRALVRYAHAAGQTDALRPQIERIFAAHPDSGAIEAVRGLDLELSGAGAEAAAAYARALELDPGNAAALAGLGRLVEPADAAVALGYFERAVAADPSDPELQLAAARALVALDRRSEARERLDALLYEHPYVHEAAYERARLDVEQGLVTDRTVERARRAAQFGGGAPALELLSEVYAQRDEPEAAARAAERARAIRESKSAAAPAAPAGEG